MNPDRLYDLVAVVVHCGSGPNRGHYISIVKSHGFWLLFDDDMVDVRIYLRHIFLANAIQTAERFNVIFFFLVSFATENRSLSNRRLLWADVGYSKVIRNWLYFVLPIQRLWNVKLV